MPYKDKAKKIENDRKYREKNREKFRISRMKSYYKHREKEIKRQTNYIKNNPNIALKCRWNYEKNHPEKTAVRTLKRRSVLKGLLFGDSRELENWLKNQKRICHYCGVDEETASLSNFNNRIGSMLQIDRVNPEGGYVVGNIVLACPVCNYVKGRWFDEKTMLEIGERYIRKLYRK